jgi:hypothetical protein
LVWDEDEKKVHFFVNKNEKKQENSNPVLIQNKNEVRSVMLYPNVVDRLGTGHSMIWGINLLFFVFFGIIK